MTPKQKVLRQYPQAFSYRIASWLVHIKSRKDGRRTTLGWGGSAKEAWSAAAENIKSKRPKPKRKPTLSHAQRCYRETLW